MSSSDPSELYQLRLFCKLSSSRKYEYRAILICFIVFNLFNYLTNFIKETSYQSYDFNLVIYVSNELQHAI